MNEFIVIVNFDSKYPYEVNKVETHTIWDENGQDAGEGIKLTLIDGFEKTGDAYMFIHDLAADKTRFKEKKNEET